MKNAEKGVRTWKIPQTFHKRFSCLSSLEPSLEFQQHSSLWLYVNVRRVKFNSFGLTWFTWKMTSQREFSCLGLYSHWPLVSKGKEITLLNFCWWQGFNPRTQRISRAGNTLTLFYKQSIWYWKLTAQRIWVFVHSVSVFLCHPWTMQLRRAPEGSSSLCLGAIMMLWGTTVTSNTGQGVSGTIIGSVNSIFGGEKLCYCYCCCCWRQSFAL
jgi:hypothetical protein